MSTESERRELSPTEQVLQQAERNIKDHIKDATQDSALWKAFADYTDYETSDFLRNQRGDLPSQLEAG